MLVCIYLCVRVGLCVCVLGGGGMSHTNIYAGSYLPTHLPVGDVQEVLAQKQ